MAMVRQLLVRGGADFSGLKKELKKTGAIIKTTNINILSSIHSADKMNVSYTDAGRGADKAAKGVKRLSKSTDGLKISIGGLGGLFKRIFAIVGVGALIRMGKESVELASNITEVQNVVNQAFGEMSGKAEEFASKAYLFNMTSLQAKKTASTYMAMGKAVGLASEQAASMAINIAALTGDMASFYDISQDTVDVAMKAVWTGETESIKKFGVVLTQANLEEYALQHGISKTWKEMTQAEKTTLRYAYVMDRLAFAQEDALRTSGSWANRVRRIGRELQDLKAVIGQGLINVFYNFLSVIESTIKRLAYFAELFRQISVGLFGDHNDPSGGEGLVDVYEAGADAVDDMTESVEELGDAMKKALLPIDQIHKLGDTDTSGLSGDGSGSDFLGLLNVNGYAEELMANNPAKNLLSDEDIADIEKKAGIITGTFEFIGGKFDELKIRFLEKLGLDVETATAKDVLDALVTYSGEKVTEILDLFGIEVDFSNVSFDGIKQKIEDFKKYLEENQDLISYTLKAIGIATVGALAIMVQQALDVLAPFLPGVKLMIEGIIEFLYGFIEVINGAISGNLDLALKGLKDMFSGAFDFIRGVVDGFIGFLASVFEFLNPFSWASKIGETVGKMTGNDEMVKNSQELAKNWTLNGAIKEAYGGWDNFSFTAVSTAGKEKSFGEWWKDLTGFASGGVVYGDSVIRVGEYAGAASNPEIVAPQGIIRETLEDANMGVIDALYAMSSRVCKAIENNRAVVNVGGKQLTDDVTRQQNDKAKMTGKPILAV